MARLVQLSSKIDQVIEGFYTRNRIAEENRERENAAAIRIQSWFRGCKVRAYLSFINSKATIIQKTWRGFRARELFRLRVKTAYFLMKMNFYNKMAVKIQQRWRGYYVRKYVHNYYARKRYLDALAKKNEQIRRELEILAEQQKRERVRVAVEREEQEKYFQAQRLHYLLSTKQCPGVFNSPFRPEPDEMELRLRKVKPVRIMSAPKETRHMLQSPRFLKSEDKLPPIHKTPQGPFRPALEVQQQKLRPLEPTLRSDTSITNMEHVRQQILDRERGTHLIDHPFVLHSKSHQNQKYKPLLHTTSPYQLMAYGTRHFREEDRSRLQGKQIYWPEQKSRSQDLMALPHL
ncbi:spermatogenesis-associated protein 17 isoform X2 [Hoplias malabaricus]|uniref:spermatogenesis-associated protein 17 isoform X2 n=1 Tax=Hoplias malabaricus TaxID=27720 RepID=UPI003462836D